MEQKVCQESSKFALDFKCEKVLEAVDESITCPTPQKMAEPLTVKSREDQTHIPEKYSTLADLFGHMSCSLRMLSLRKKTPTFLNVCRQVEVLSKRKFSHAHLAQMKYILPESVFIDKVLVHDKKTLCMVPDMKITLTFEVVKDCSGESTDLALQRYFKSKLVDFFDKHPEVADIPEAILPEPFSKKSCSLYCEVPHVVDGQSLDVHSSMEHSPISNQTEVLPEQFQLYPRHFFRKNIADQAEKAQCFSLTKISPSSHASDCLDNEESEKALQNECSPLSDHVANLSRERGHPKESFSTSFQPGVINTPVHMIHPPHSVTCSNSESPDMKNISCVADSFMTETPAQPVPSRLLPNSDVKRQDMPTQKTTSSHKPAKRVLNFSLMKDNDGRGCFEDCNSFGSVSVPQELVERARALLKSLLDVAVESIFESHLKESKSPVATNISQTSVEYPTCSKMTSEEDEQPQLKLLSKKEQLELSKFSISDDGGTKCEILRSIGENNSMMQQSSVIKETNLSNGNGIFPKTEISHNKQQHNGVNALYSDDEHAKDSEQNEENNISLLSRIHEAQSSSNAVGQVEDLDQKGDFSDDLVKTIKRIESRILAFQLCSNLLDSTKNSAGLHTTHEAAKSDSPVIQRNDGVSGSQLSSGKCLLEGHRLMNQKTLKRSWKGGNSNSANAFEEPYFGGNELLSQSQMENKKHRLHTNVESAKSNDVPHQIGTNMVSGGQWLGSRNMIDRAKSLNRLVSSDVYFGSQGNECIQGLRVPLNQDNHSKKHSMLASKTNREGLARKNPVAWSKTDQNPKAMSSESSYAQKLAGSKSIIARREKLPLHQMVMKPTLLDQRSSEIKVNSHQQRDSSVLDRRRTLKTGHLERRKTRVLPQHHELEESRSNSESSRGSSPQGSANSSSHSEGYSLPDGTQCPSSGRMVEEAYEGSSEESNNSYFEKDDGCERNPKETIGRLRRLRNKMGIIFHHHHHHHHHHHGHGHGTTHSRAGQRHNMWNQLQNVFHHKDKHGMRTKRVGKTRRGGVAKVLPRKNQIGQFHRLVEGVLRHIQHSKKPKPSRFDGVNQSRNIPHGHSQKKLGWWQILRPHRGVKLKNKGRVKMGFKSQKSIKNC